MTLKLDWCPECGYEELNDYWQKDRKLQQSCPNCNWVGEIRIPELKEIKTKKLVMVNRFSGFYYEIYDRYGHIKESSKSYWDKNKAKQNLLETIEKGKIDKHAGPYTGILYPDVIEVEGEVFT